MYHLFYVCCYIQTMWHFLQSICDRVDANINLLDPKKALFGGDFAWVLNIILMLVESSIFVCKNENSVPSLVGYQNLLEKYFRLW